MKLSKLLVSILGIFLWMGASTNTLAQDSPGNYSANEGSIADGQSNAGEAGRDNVSIQIAGSTGKVRVRIAAREVEAVSASSSSQNGESQEFKWPWED